MSAREPMLYEGDGIIHDWHQSKLAAGEMARRARRAEAVLAASACDAIEDDQAPDPAAATIAALMARSRAVVMILMIHRFFALVAASVRGDAATRERKVSMRLSRSHVD